MSEYVNGANIAIIETVRLEFTDTKPNNAGIVNVASLVMNYETFKGMTEAMVKVVKDHDEKIALAAEEKRKAN